MDKTSVHSLTDPRYITFLLQAEGWSQTRLARETMRSRAAVSYAIQTGCSQAVTGLICRILKSHPWDHWPHRYRKPIEGEMRDPEPSATISAGGFK